jgi:hypothetical protein
MPKLCFRRCAAPLLAGLLALTTASAQETVRWHGTELDLPTGWSQEATSGVLLLKPAGWKQGEVTGEAYGLLFDDETKSLDDDELADTIDAAADEIVAGLQRTGDPTAGKVGALASKSFRYAGETGEGKKVAMTIHVFAGKDGCIALFAMGFTDKLASRDKELTAMLGSVRLEGQKKPRRAFGMGKQDPAGEPAPAEKPAPAPPTETPAAEAPTPTPAPAPADAPSAVRIPGGREVAWNGVLVDVPKDWQVQAGDDGTQLLLPPGFGQSGVLDEVYALCGDGSLRTLEGRDTMSKLQEALDEIQPGLRPKGAGAEATFGALKGKQFTFVGSTPTGDAVEARIYAFPAGNGIGALVSLGFPKTLQQRQKSIDAVLQSLRGAPAGKAGAAPAELAGQWVFYVGTQANNGGGSSRQKVLTLRADGTYSFVAENVSTNPNGAAWGDRNDSGRWSVDGNRITFRSQAGGSVTYSLQKRNHRKNNDPMLVIDGDEFVTATQRAPW